MTYLVLFRIATAVPMVKFNAQRRKAVADALASARVRRPSLEDFILSNALASMPPISRASFDAACAMPEPKRSEWLLDHGWVIAEDSLGRGGEANESTRESVRLWIAQRIATEHGSFIPRDAIAIAIAHD